MCIRDRCSGSGHILAYMFDVLMKIYESYGYTTREAVVSIVENNLYGLDIDDRAAQLAYFAVMKMCIRDRYSSSQIGIMLSLSAGKEAYLLAHPRVRSLPPSEEFTLSHSPPA